MLTTNFSFIITLFFIAAAIAGSDYISVTKQIIFTNYSVNPHSIYIPIVNDDDCVEESEYFSVNITTDMDCVYLPVDSRTITILDDEGEFYICWYQNLFLISFGEPKYIHRVIIVMSFCTSFSSSWSDTGDYVCWSEWVWHNCVCVCGAQVKPETWCQYLPQCVWRQCNRLVSDSMFNSL